MTTIHIVIPDHAEALSIIAAALNGGYQVSIDLDEIDHTGIAQQAFDETGPTRANAKARIKASQIKAAAFIAERDAKNAEREAYFAKQAEKAAAKREREADRVVEDIGVINARKQAAYDARWKEAQEARNVACPNCQAPIDMPCVSPSGKAYGVFAHVDRISAAYNLRNGVL